MCSCVGCPCVRLLFDVCCVLLVVRCSLCVVVCLLLAGIGHVGCLLCGVCWLLVVGCCLCVAACCLV